jgi:hypothetical protein
MNKLGRDPKRIAPLLGKLEKAWNATGTDQLRFGQLIENILYSQKTQNKLGLWVIEDDTFEKLIDKWVEDRK